ncbi:MAG: CAP domain-containing protein [Alphaproteobacteria bacterium]|nr:CAP domain-containing protein [Alphaproteobacteria bacterium]
MGLTGNFIRAIGFAVLLLAAGCAETVSPPKPDPATEMPALESRIYTLVQEERRKIDPTAPALVLDPELVDVARKRSAQMAKANAFSTGDDPHASATILMAEDAQFQGLVGENVAAQHYTVAGGIDVDAFARRFVDSWMASTPHKQNLAFPDYSRSGVGAALNGDTVYVTQLFVSDLGLGPAPKDGTPAPVERVDSPQKGKDDAQTVPLRGPIVPGSRE